MDKLKAELPPLPTYDEIQQRFYAEAGVAISTATTHMVRLMMRDYALSAISAMRGEAEAVAWAILDSLNGKPVLTTFDRSEAAAYRYTLPLYAHPPRQDEQARDAEERERFQAWYTGITVEGDMRHNMERAWLARASISTAQPDMSTQSTDHQNMSIKAQEIDMSRKAEPQEGEGK